MIRVFYVNRRFLIGFCLMLSVFTFMMFYFVVLNASNRNTGVSGQVRKLPIYCVENEKNEIAITFDCAWGALL